MLQNIFELATIWPQTNGVAAYAIPGAVTFVSNGTIKTDDANEMTENENTTSAASKSHTLANCRGAMCGIRPQNTFDFSVPWKLCSGTTTFATAEVKEVSKRIIDFAQTLPVEGVGKFKAPIKY